MLAPPGLVMVSSRPVTKRCGSEVLTVIACYCYALRSKEHNVSHDKVKYGLDF